MTWEAIITPSITVAIAIVGLIVWLVRVQSQAKAADERSLANEDRIKTFVAKDDIHDAIHDAVEAATKNIEIDAMKRFVDRDTHKEMMSEMYRKFEMLGEKIDRLVDRFIDYSPPPPTRFPAPKPRVRKPAA